MAKPRNAPTAMAVREFARRFGVSASAVRKAAREGRLSGSIGYTAKGHLVILDAVLARREWEAHTRPWIGYNSGRGLVDFEQGSDGQ